MTVEAHDGDARVRLFVALDLPAGARRGLAEWARAASADAALRPVAERALHVTLCFCGDHPESAVEPIARLVRATPAMAVGLRLEAAPVGLPSPRPRLYAVGVAAPGAVALQASLAPRLVAGGFMAPEERPFWPHITFARVRRRAGARREPRRVEDPPGELPAALLEPFGAVRIALYRSDLRPEGAQYVSLASLDLPPPV